MHPNTGSLYCGKDIGYFSRSGMLIQQNVLDDIRAFRHLLHQHPELSGQEQQTAERVRHFVQQYQPNTLITGIGGHGIAAVYNGENSGPTVLIRCELDALPIAERNDMLYRSHTDGVAHKCGHDGHMAIVAGLAALLHKQPPKHGRVVLLFQPAEETGEGAAQVLADTAFPSIQPDYAFALHNLPGIPRGHVVLRDGVFAAASKGMIIYLHGETAHAAHPEDARSPALAMATILQDMHTLHKSEDYNDFTLLTVIHAQLGERAFGTTPGDATIMATLRAYNNDDLQQLTQRAEELVQKQAALYTLEACVEYTDVFPATVNHPEAMHILRSALGPEVTMVEAVTPFRWSEDFGHFSSIARTAFFGIGAGEQHPQLHHSLYDFPDDILGTGIQCFYGIVDKLLGTAST